MNSNVEVGPSRKEQLAFGLIKATLEVMSGSGMNTAAKISASIAKYKTITDAIDDWTDIAREYDKYGLVGDLVERSNPVYSLLRKYSAEFDKYNGLPEGQTYRELIKNAFDATPEAHGGLDNALQDIKDKCFQAGIEHRIWDPMADLFAEPSPDIDPSNPDVSNYGPNNLSKPEVVNPRNFPSMHDCLTSCPQSLSPENFSSPLVLDLNNNNRTSTSLIMSDTHFDLDGDSFAERTGWVEAEDGLLVIDKNQNGIIDNGSELFGNYTSKQNGQLAEHGFDALTDYDTNSDGVIDSNDEVFDSLQVWIDENTDGQTQDGELHSLNELHINSINLNATSVNQGEMWNIISHESSFTQQVVDEDGIVVTDEDGNAVLEEKAVRDVWFANDRQDTTYQYDGEISSEIEALPEMVGMGRVMNLSHSMAEDLLLQQQVETFLVSTGSDLTSLYEQADEILARWTHTEDIDPDEARGEQYVLNHNYSNPQTKYVFREYANAREVAILESFAGKLFQMTVDGQVTDQVLDSKTARAVRVKYDYLRDTLMINLLSQNLFGKDIYNTETASLQADALLTLQNTLLTSATSDELLAAVNLLVLLL